MDPKSWEKANTGLDIVAVAVVVSLVTPRSSRKEKGDEGEARGHACDVLE